MRHAALISAIGITLSACGGGGGGDEDVTPITLAKLVSNVQCEPPRTTLKQLDEELVRAGVSIQAKRCAWDGMIYLAVCGAPTTYLRVIQVSKHDEGTARSLGYVPQTDFPTVIPSECPSQ